MSKRVPYRWVVAFVLFFAYSIQYLDRVKTNVLNPAIAKDIGLSTIDIGTGAFLMMLFYGPAQYVSGWLTDRFGAKRILLFSVVAWSIMTAWMGVLHSREEYLWRMALFGLLVGTEYVPSARVLMRWFNKEGRARAQALLSWSWILTPAWASIFATQVAAYTGSWRLVFFITAAMGIVPLFLILFMVFDRPEQYRNITPEELEYSYRDEIEKGTLSKGDYHETQKKILQKNTISFVDFFKNPSYVAVVVVDIVMQLTFWGAMVWIPLYLSDVFGFRLAKMGLWNAMYFVAGAFGSFLSSHLSDKVFHGNRRVMIMACFLGLAPFILMLGTLHRADQTLLAVALCGMGFFGNMAWGPFLAVPAEIFTPEVYGKAMGFVNGVGYFSAAFSAKIFAALVVVQNGQKIYSGGWYFLSACVAIGVIAATFIRTPASRGQTASAAARGK